MIDFTKPVYARADGTYVVTLNGLPYQVLQSDLLYSTVQAWVAQGGKTQTEPSPVAVPPDPVTQANATLQDIMLKYVNTVMVGPTAPLQFATQWLAAWKTAGR